MPRVSNKPRCEKCNQILPPPKAPRVPKPVSPEKQAKLLERLAKQEAALEVERKRIGAILNAGTVAATPPAAPPVPPTT